MHRLRMRILRGGQHQFVVVEHIDEDRVGADLVQQELHDPLQYAFEGFGGGQPTADLMKEINSLRRFHGLTGDSWSWDVRSHAFKVGGSDRRGPINAFYLGDNLHPLLV